MNKTITRQTVYSEDFQEKVLDRIQHRVHCDMIVFGRIKASEMRDIIKEALNDYLIGNE